MRVEGSRVMVLGCGGMLGSSVRRHLVSIGCEVHASDIDVNEDWLSYLDVRHYESVRSAAEEFRPDLIINLAALTDLEACERDHFGSWMTNSLGAENCGLVANGLGVPYVYISTAGVFGGEQEFYTDYDAPRPLSAYARSKHWGESWTLRSAKEGYVFRAGWMMGGGPRKDKKFINKLVRQLTAGKDVLHVVDDKLGTPTYTEDFARGIVRVVSAGVPGLYNQVCGGSGSRYDVALRVVEGLGLGGRVSVVRVDSDHFKEEYFAPRPASEKLVNLKLDALGLNVMRDWETCLDEYLEEFRPLFAK